MIPVQHEDLYVDDGAPGQEFPRRDFERREALTCTLQDAQELGMQGAGVF